MLELDLTGKIALITGATGQLGRVMAHTLADCGADIVVHYHANRLQADKLVAELTRMGRRALAVQADVTERDSVFAMRDKVEAVLGMPQILVHNAVIQYAWKPVLQQDPGDFDSQYRSCVMQTVYMAQAFVPAMQAAHYGRILVINTECAALAEAGCGAYTAAKRGLDGLCRCLAKEVAGDGITVNQIAPGWTITERDRDANTQVQPDYDRQVPMGRRGTDAEIAQMVAFLVSDLASFTTGAFIPVCGGRVMPAI